MNIERLFTLASSWSALYPDAAPRIARAHAVVLAAGVTYAGDNEYFVQASDGQGAYIVSGVPGKAECTCADYACRQTRCKHIWAASLWATAQERPARQRQPKTDREQLGEVTAKHHRENHAKASMLGGAR